jgi:HK97 family phage portal protein
MGLWSWLTGGVNHSGEIANANPPATPSTVGAGEASGDPNGVEIVGPDVEARSLPAFYPSPWNGWPSSWSTPNWDGESRFNELIDVAWTCMDKNASVLSTLPVFKTRGGKVMSPSSWMINPDPSIYSSWEEFANQLFWDVQLGEAFIVAMSRFSDDYPMRFRVIPGWAFHVEMVGGVRRYKLGGETGIDVTEDVLHIRYKSTTDSAHGVGPLEVAGGRMLTAGLIAKYVREMAATGGVPTRTIEAADALTPDEAQRLMDAYMTARVQNATAPPVFDNGATLKDHPAVSPKEMAMHELEQFNEARIAVLLGVPPFLVGLPSGGDSMTYSNVSTLFDYHDRQKLRSLAVKVMSALSYWALPLGQQVEINRDEYSRPPFDQRAEAWSKLIASGVITPEDVAVYENFQGAAPGLPTVTEPMDAITGGEQ